MDMDRGSIYIYTGEDAGRASAPWDLAVEAAAEGRSVVLIRFSEAREWEDSAFIRRMEPEIRLFHFEAAYGLSYAKKVLAVSECDLLILDGILDLAEKKDITAAELKELLENRRETDVLLTGSGVSREISSLADRSFCVLPFVPEKH